MMLAEIALVLTKDHLLILAHQGAVEYLLLLLLLLLLLFFIFLMGATIFCFSGMRLIMACPLVARRPLKQYVLCITFYSSFVL